MVRLKPGRAGQQRSLQHLLRVHRGHAPCSSGSALVGLEHAGGPAAQRAVGKHLDPADAQPRHRPGRCAGRAQPRAPGCRRGSAAARARPARPGASVPGRCETQGRRRCRWRCGSRRCRCARGSGMAARTAAVVSARPGFGNAHGSAGRPRSRAARRSARRRGPARSRRPATSAVSRVMPARRSAALFAQTACSSLLSSATGMIRRDLVEQAPVRLGVRPDVLVPAAAAQPRHSRRPAPPHRYRPSGHGGDRRGGRGCVASRPPATPAGPAR